MTASRLLCFVVASLTLAACDVPDVRLVDPEVSGDEIARIEVRLEDSALAHTLGWTEGVPDAEVYLMRVGEPFNPRIETTDVGGVVQLSDIVPGLYRVAAYRVLEENETGPTDGKVRAFGGGRLVNIANPSSVGLTLRTDQAGSLVISEVYAIQQAYAYRYQWFTYFELYNNGDTTVFLDGMVWGRVLNHDWDFEVSPCQLYEPFTNDSQGVWAMYFHRFPGNGNDYPVAPGQTVTVALDAVDHSVVDSKFPDLTHADFELEGNADADNPDVPNMPEVGTRTWYRGHGLDFTLMDILFLAASVDLASLPHTPDPIFPELVYVRFPTQQVLDVISMAHDHYYTGDRLGRPCDVYLHPSFDRSRGGYYDTMRDTTLSLHRRILRVAEGGRVILQDVNVSFLDLVVGEHSPGRIEY